MGMTFEARSENGYGKWHFLVWNWVWIWGCGRHTPTTNSKEYPPGLFPTTGWICVCWSQIQLLHVAFVNSHLVRIPTDKFSSSSASCFNLSNFMPFYFIFIFVLSNDNWQQMTTPGTELNTELLLALPVFLSRSQQSGNIIYLTDSPFMI